MKYFRWPLILLALLALTCRNLPPRDPAAPEGYEIARTGISYNYTTTGRDLDEGDQVAVQFDWGDGTQTEWSELKESGATFSADHAWQAEGEYLVTARARDQRGSVSNWSDSLLVYVWDDASNPPGQPMVLVNPDSAWLGKEHDLFIFASDPEGDSVQLQFAWEHGDTSQWSDWVASGETVSVRTAVQGRTNPARVRAWARDDWRSHSPWSDWAGVVVHREGTVRWARPLETDWFCCPAIGPDGTVYVATGDQGLLALNPASGRVLWRDGSATGGNPVIDADGTIHYPGDGLLNALNPNGTVKWRFVPAQPATNLALAPGGTLIASDWSGNVCAYGPDTVLQWERDLGEPRARTPTVVGPDGTIYARGRDDRIFALNPDGSDRWDTRLFRMGNLMALSIGADGTLYALGGSDYSSLFAVDPDSGTVRWEFDRLDGLGFNTVIRPDGTVIAVGEFYLHAIGPDGQERWRLEYDDGIADVPAVALCADGTVICPGWRELLGVGNGDSLRWVSKVKGEACKPPAVGPDGTIYVLDYHDTLYAVHGPAPLADSPWPKFQRDLGNTGRQEP